MLTPTFRRPLATLAVLAGLLCAATPAGAQAGPAGSPSRPSGSTPDAIIAILIGQVRQELDASRNEVAIES